MFDAVLLFRDALYGALLIALTCSVIGVYVVLRRIVFVGAALAMFAFDFWTISGALVISGLGIAPALAVMFSIVSASVKFSDTAEAYGWVGTGQLVGAALGSAAAGFLIEELLEPHPAPEMADRYPEDYAQLEALPAFVAFRLIPAPPR